MDVLRRVYQSVIPLSVYLQRATGESAEPSELSRIVFVCRNSGADATQVPLATRSASSERVCNTDEWNEVAGVAATYCRLHGKTFDAAALTHADWPRVLQFAGSRVVFHLLTETTLFLCRAQSFVQLTGKPFHLLQTSRPGQPSALADAPTKRRRTRRCALKASVGARPSSPPPVGRRRHRCGRRRVTRFASTPLRAKAKRRKAADQLEGHALLADCAVSPVAFAYTADLRERLHPCRRPAKSTPRDSGGEQLFRQVFADAPLCFERSSIDCRSEIVGYLSDVQRNYRRRCCLPPLLDKWLPVADGLLEMDLAQLVCESVDKDALGRFLRAYLSRLLPDELLGAKNKAVYISNAVGGIVKARKYEWSGASAMASGLSASGCGWLRALSTRATQQDAFCRLICWLSRLVVALVRGCFYVTENQWEKNQLVFYRKPVWRRVRQLAACQFRRRCCLTRLGKEHAARLAKASFLSTPTALRFMPKTGGVRAIVVSQRRRSNDVAKINWRLQPLRAALALLCRLCPELLGDAHSSGSVTMHRRWLGFVQAVRKRRAYLATADIHACFDHMDQQQLLSLLTEALFDKRFPSHVLVQTYRVAGLTRASKVQRRLKHFATVDGGGEHTATFGKKVVAVKTGCSTLSRDVMVQQLTSLIRNHVLALGGKRWLQTRGIQQGSVVSVLLCDVYLARVERHCWPRLAADDAFVALRHVDDYLIASTQRAPVANFIDFLMNGCGELFGVHARAEKVHCNLDAAGERTLKWCGLVVDCHTLQVRPDTSRWQAVAARQLLSSSAATEPTRLMRRSLRGAVACRAPSVCFDRRVNGDDGVRHTERCLLALTQRLFDAYCHLRRIPATEQFLLRRRTYFDMQNLFKRRKQLIL